MNRKQTLIALFAASAVLSGCGGGGGGSDDPPVPPPAATDAVPDSANASAAGLVAYLDELAAMLVEDKEPVNLSTFLPATSENAEPEAVE
jgi:hypothetical protein